MDWIDEVSLGPRHSRGSTTVRRIVIEKTFTIIAESMIDTDADLKIDEIIADRLDEAAVDVCDELGITNAIYRGE